MRYSKSLLAVVFLALITLSAWDGWASATVQAEPANLTPVPEPATSTPVHPTHTPTPEATHTPLPEPTHTPLHTPPATPEPTHTPGGTIPPPTATPIQDGWDRASVSTFGACKDGRPLFNILNSGLAMREARPFWFLNVTGDTASCAADIANIANIIDSGVFQLGAGEAVDLVVPDGIGLKTPLRICARRSAFDPGGEFVSASLAPGACFTGEDVTKEPGPWGQWQTLLPLLRR